MGHKAYIKPRGLFTAPNSLSGTPDGSLTVAENVGFLADGRLATRTGWVDHSTKTLTALFDYSGTLWGHTTATLSKYAASTWSDITGAISAVSGYRMRSQEFAKNLFLTSSVGVQRVDTTTATTVGRAGCPAGADISLAQGATGSAVATANQVGYRQLFGTKDANGRFIFGAPTGRVVYANSSGLVKDVTVTVTLPADVTTSHFVQLYRTQVSGGIAIDPGDECGLVYEFPVPASATSATFSRAATLVQVTTTAAHGFIAGQIVNVATGSANFPVGNKLITGLGIDPVTQFTYTEAGAAVSENITGTLRPITTIVTDVCGDNFIGASLYSNQSQEGILRSNDRPPLCRDMAEYGGSLWFANVNVPAQTTIALLGAGGNMANDDTITINAVVFTAKAAESIQARQFLLGATGTASQKIKDTAESLIRVINRDQSAGVYARDISDPNGLPGLIQLTRTDATNTLAVSYSRPASWSPAAQTVSPQNFKNGIAWSKTDQPDHVPYEQTLAGQPLLIGSAAYEIQRVLSTRTGLWVLKADGIWRITGSNEAWDVTQFDPSISVVNPYVAVVLNNAVFAMSTAGALRISDTGVAIISDPVRDRLYEGPDSEGPIGIAIQGTGEWMTFGAGVTGGWTYNAIRDGWTTHSCLIGHAITSLTTGSVIVGTSSTGIRDFLYGCSSTKVYSRFGVRVPVDLSVVTDDRAAGSPYELTGSYTIAGAGTATTLELTSVAGLSVGDRLKTRSILPYNYAIVRSIVGTTVTTHLPHGSNGLEGVTAYRAIPVSVTMPLKFGDTPAGMAEIQEVVFVGRWWFDRGLSVWAGNGQGLASGATIVPTALDSANYDGAQATTWTGLTRIRYWPETGAAIAPDFMAQMTMTDSGWFILDGIAFYYNAMGSEVSR